MLLINDSELTELACFDAVTITDNMTSYNVLKLIWDS